MHLRLLERGIYVQKNKRVRTHPELRQMGKVHLKIPDLAQYVLSDIRDDY